MSLEQQIITTAQRLKNYFLIFVFFLVPVCGDCQATIDAQSLQLKIKADKAVYEFGDKVYLQVTMVNLSSKEFNFLPFLMSSSVVLDGKTIQRTGPFAWGGRGSVDPKSEWALNNIGLKEYFDISRDLLKIGEHSLIFQMGGINSNKIIFEVKTRETIMSDPIDRLVERLSKTHGLWKNGIVQTISLPSTVTIEEVVAKVFQITNFNEGHVTDYKILEMRAVEILEGVKKTSPYWTVSVKTNFGNKIIVLQLEQHQDGTTSWWHKIFSSEITKDEAISIAQKICAAENWKWKDVKIEHKDDQWQIVTNSSQQGGNAVIDVDLLTGNVIKKDFINK